MTDTNTALEALAEIAWREYLEQHGYTTMPLSPDTGADFWAGFNKGYDAILASGLVVTTAEADLPSREEIADVIEREIASYLPQTTTEPPESLLRSHGSDMSERVTAAVLTLLRGGA